QKMMKKKKKKKIKKKKKMMEKKIDMIINSKDQPYFLQIPFSAAKYCSKCHQSNHDLNQQWDDVKDNCLFEWNVPDQNDLPKSDKSAYPSPDYRISKKVQRQVHEKIIAELIVQQKPYNCNYQPLSLKARSIYHAHNAQEMAYYIYTNFHPEKANFFIQELRNDNVNNKHINIDPERQPSTEDIQELSTVLHPLRAGINPKYLDPRLIAEAANRIRAFRDRAAKYWSKCHQS
ncbi:MAG: hypothetical protein EZS28_043379, partial [Streblomastix strix]